MAVTGSMAADLPSRKAAPVDYVRVCSVAGVTGFVIPGTDHCLKISGQARADYLFGPRFSDRDEGYGINVRARVNFDVYSQTGIGTVRTFIGLEGSNLAGRSGFGFGNASTVTTTRRNTGFGGTDFNVRQAFIQFGLGSGVVTAGRAVSFFDFYGTDGFWNFAAISGTQGTNANMLAYTANFGGGLTATLGVEDRGVNDMNTIDTAVFPAAAIPGSRAYQGRSYPDLVANLRIAQGWGTAQLMAAARQVSIADFPANVAGVLQPAAFKGSKTGFALGAGVSINLPALGAGSILMLEGTYAKGMASYSGFGASARVGFANAIVSDFAYDATSFKLAETFSVLAALRAQWTPALRQHIFAGYSSVSYGSLGNANGGVVGGGFGLPTANSTVGLRSFTKFEVGTNLMYAMAPGLQLGVEVLYSNVDPKGSFTTAKNRLTSSQSAVEGRFRIVRDF
jgi:hypothetical protein